METSPLRLSLSIIRFALLLISALHIYALPLSMCYHVSSANLWKHMAAGVFFSSILFYFSAVLK